MQFENTRATGDDSRFLFFFSINARALHNPGTNSPGLNLRFGFKARSWGLVDCSVTTQAKMHPSLTVFEVPTYLPTYPYAPTRLRVVLTVADGSRASGTPTTFSPFIEYILNWGFYSPPLNTVQRIQSISTGKWYEFLGFFVFLFF